MSRRFRTFAELFAAEHQQLSEAFKVEADLTLPVQEYVTGEGTSGEPWVKTAPVDRVGLALSGGGIRSAIFNLGLLEALDQRGILSLVDYLSTVSGGGYIGGFWTAWRARTTEECAESIFPHRNSTDVREKGDPDSRERPETRHLREFSRFLMPRIGLNQPEMWFALATIFGGMLPALLVTFAAVSLFLYAWLAVGYVAVYQKYESAVFIALTLLLHFKRRRKWVNESREEYALNGNAWWKALYWIGALLTTALGAWFLSIISAELRGTAQWGWLTDEALRPKRFITFAFEPAVTWIALAFFVSFVWIFFEALCRAFENRWSTGVEEQRERLRQRRLRRAAVRDQLSSRYLAWAVVAAAVACVWELSFKLSNAATDAHQGGNAIAGAGGVTAVFTALYIWVRNWLTKPDKQSQSGSFWRKIFKWGKAFLPMLLATAGALSLVIFTVLVVRFYGLGWKPNNTPPVPSIPETWQSILFCAAIAAAVILVALKIFDPAHFGLHDFYRGRIARAFLGAAFKAGPRWVAEQEGARYMRENVEKAAQLRAHEEEEALAAAKKSDLSERERAKFQKTAQRKARQQDYMEDFLSRTGQSISAKPSASDNRYIMERPEDDLCLTSLPTRRDEVNDVQSDSLVRLRLRPIHLICCAANHLTGDALPTLSRGARSAVLSQHGVSIGNDSSPPRTWDPELMLSAAQTASAAAFNSQMGEKSLRLGPASSFLMSALNLRLGLWVTNPASQRIAADRIVFEGLVLRPIQRERIKGQRLKHPWLSMRAWLGFKLFRLRWRIHESNLFHIVFDLPGRAFFRELFGRSSALSEDRAPQLHLSDGGHFENLGLYELIRRHARYIIVSDAGQDEEVAFDDLGNAIRRVREDFGVEIEIDLAAIRPDAELRSQQHVVVGTIHYDGFEGCDKGTLLYIKPTVTGDEPGDIQQYRTRNRIFPHEPTSDQFFAEAQWESYRRLGEHIGQVCFAFVDLMSNEQRRQPETVFWQLRAAWSNLPSELHSGLRDVAAKFRQFDEDFAKGAPSSLRMELWPEVAASQPLEEGLHPGKTSAEKGADESVTVSYLMSALQLLEEAWLMLRLDDFWTHPSNIGVMSRFRRWFATPSMRRWWVLLSPLCCNDFREFIKINFHLRARDPEARKTDVGRAGPVLQLRRAERLEDVGKGIAWTQMEARKRTDIAEYTAFEYMLRLENDPEDRLLQVGLAFVNLPPAELTGDQAHVARWSEKDFFVPESFSGAGFNSRFLDRLIVELRKSGVERICVTLQDEFQGRRDEAAREARLNLIGFYKSRHFIIQPPTTPGDFAELHLDL